VLFSGACLDPVTVNIRLVDSETGLTTPAMICITDALGVVRLPPDGRFMGGIPNQMVDFVYGARFDPDPNWIGPIRDMRCLAAPELQAVPYWQEPVMFQVSGDFTIDLTPGTYRIAVDHGPEYIPVVEDLVVLGPDAMTRDLELSRWIHMSAEGWFSGDMHVHHPTLDPEHRDFVLQYARASDVHMISTLEMGFPDDEGTWFPNAGYGAPYRFCLDDTCLSPGQEDPRGNFGHVDGLNLEAMVRDLDQYDFYDLVFDGIHEQPGALAGFAHFSSGGDNLRGFPWYVTFEALDFVELLQFRLMHTQRYHDYLNLGFRLTAAAGSDIPWASTMGEVRTYVYTGPTFTTDAWYAGLAAGNTFVTNGPMLSFSVDGEMPGSEVSKNAGETVNLSASVMSHPGIGVPQWLAVYSNEGVIGWVANEGLENELTLAFPWTVEESRWFAVGTSCDNGAEAHTTPVYVVVDGRPTFSRELGPALIQDQLDVIDAVEADHTPVQNDYDQGIIDRLDFARAYYADLLDQMLP